jgi:bis(5'-nucleosyl)-tetraphosphatase (symmetrical)
LAIFKDAVTPLDNLVGTLPVGSKIICVGDLVNRGPNSLGTLRRLKAWQESGNCECILGNHDLHLLARDAGIRGPKSLDTLDDVLNAPDRAELIDWLRKRPLALFDGSNLFIHAGVLPQWNIHQTMELADEVQKALRRKSYVKFLESMYGNTPTKWTNTLKGADRLRVIVNAFTRMRFCSAKGEMDFATKEGLSSAPKNFFPWFDVPKRKTENIRIYFGHWSTMGLVKRKNVIGLDTGCVWGGSLTAMSLDQDPVMVQTPGLMRHVAFRVFLFFKI